jgi:membrane-bound lytic murein transglycosylase B
MLPCRSAIRKACLAAIAGAGLLASAMAAHTAQAQAAAPASAVADQAGGFQRFIQNLWPLAQARGISRATFDAAFRGLTPDASIIALTRKQSEFVAPIWTYLTNAVGGSRIARGQAALQANAAALASIEQTYWSAEGDRRRHLGHGDGLRLVQGRQGCDPLAGDAGGGTLSR